MELCYIDGEFVPPKQAKLPVSDLIIQRGVGVFEAFGTIEGRPLMMTLHLERLLKSAGSANIHPEFNPEISGCEPEPDRQWQDIFLEHMKKIIREGIDRVRQKLDNNSNHELSIKVYLTGGDTFDEDRGFIKPRLLITFEKLLLPPKDAYENGVKLDPLPFNRDGNPSIKSIDYRATYTRPSSGASFEVLYCPNGEITEAGHSTFFMVLKHHEHVTLVTAPLSRVLAGTTRRAILELARDVHEPGLEIEVIERCPLVSELSSANEAFITGSTKQVLPVVKVGNITIGNGCPGSVTKRLAELYKKHIQSWLE